MTLVVSLEVVNLQNDEPNVYSPGVVQGLSEAINFGINAGLDMDKVMATISKVLLQSWQMENRYRTMTDDKFDYGFAVDWMRKDLKICIEEIKNGYLFL